MIAFRKLLVLFIFVTYSTTVFAETTALTICEWEGYIMPWKQEFQAYAKAR